MKKERFSLRKYKFGLASVLLGAVFVFGNGAVQADEVPASTDLVQISPAASPTEAVVASTTEEVVAPVDAQVETATTPIEASVVEAPATETVASESSVEAAPATEATTTTAPAAVSEAPTPAAESGVPAPAVAPASTEETSAPAPTAEAPAEKAADAATPQSTSSNAIINVPQTWNQGYKGEGTVIAIIDSGLDLEHDVLRITDVTKAKYKNSEEMDAVKEKAGIDYGKWYSDKVVFAYDYMDADDNIKEADTRSHGMHVTGIAAGNPSKPISSGETVYGVAPEAQVMFMRVFVDRSATTSQSVYVKAIEDAVKLGADTINMSLGSSTGSVVNISPALQHAIDYARQNGVSVLISAGNSNVFGSGYAKPLATNPDYGTVGDPSTVEGSISVASVNNSVLTAEVMEVKGLEDDESQNRGKWTYTMGITEGRFDQGKAYDYVYAGLGQESDFEGIDVAGKLALIQRGSIAFSDKINNALQRGAIGAVIYNNVEGANVNMQLEGAAAQAPSIFISKAQGEALKDHSYQLVFNQNVADVAAVRPNELSDFSSWGVTVDGELKPDVTAPGGYIYSSLNDNTYGSMNGTSMAAPHVAGVAALVTEYVKKTYPDKTPAEVSELVKALIMSTAKPHLNKETGTYTSPRQQGAGIVDTAAAVSTGLYVTGENLYPSVSLGNVGDTFSFDVVLHNVTDQDRTLKMIVNTGTDQVQDGRFTLTPRKLTETVWPEVTVKAGSTETVTVKVDTTKFTQELSQLMPNGYFLEGFVRFVDPADDGDVVSLPFVGFKGEFQNLPVNEAPIYTLVRDGKDGFYYNVPADKTIDTSAPASYFITTSSETLASTGATENHGLRVLGTVENADGNYALALDENGQVRLAFSPNEDGNKDEIMYRSVFYRNAYNIVAAVYAATDTALTQPLWESATATDARMNYYDGNDNNPKASYITNTNWTGRDSQGNLLPDGLYTFVIRATPGVPGADEQETRFTIQIDTQAPLITTGYITEQDGKRIFTARAAKDPGEGGIQSQRLFYLQANEAGRTSYLARDVNGQVHTYENRVYITANEDGSFTLPEGVTVDQLFYAVEDYAGNRDQQALSNFVTEENSGRVQVRLVDADTGALVRSSYVYRIRDAAGKYVSLDKSKAINNLPFGHYEVELFTYSTSDIKLKSNRVLALDLTAENSLQTVDFLVKEIVSAPLSIIFNQAIPKTTAVVLQDADGELVALPFEKYGRNSYGKEVATGTYRLATALPTGYELYDAPESITIVAGKTNRINLQVVSKVNLLAALTQSDAVLKAARYYNADAVKQEGYRLALSAAQAGVTGKLTQAEVDQLLANLEAAVNQLDGQATDVEQLKKTLQTYASLTQTGRYANARAKYQQAFDKAFQDLALLLTRDEITQAQLDQAIARLDQSSKALDGKATNFTSLQKLIDSEIKYQASNVKFIYATDEVKAAYLVAFHQAQAVLENPGSSQEDVKEAINQVKAAKKKLNGKKPKVVKPKRG